MPLRIFSVVALSSVLIAATGAAPRLLVGPDSRAAADTQTPHAEMMIAAHPADPQKLLAASIVMVNDRAETHAYTSSDGGQTWITRTPFLQASGDPIAAYGPDGTAYYGFLGDATGGFEVYHSSDDGQTWAGESLGKHYDHPQIIIDSSNSSYRGRVYISVLYGKYPEYTVGIFRSSDDGKTFEGPIQVADMNDTAHGINSFTPVVFSDGSVMVFYSDFSLNGGWTTTSTHFFGAKSSDGGTTFGAPVHVADQYIGTYAQMMERNHAGEFANSGFPQAVADASNGPFRDRVYIVWPDLRAGHARLMFTMSSDKGATWSQPVPLTPDVPAAAKQFQPSIAVNKDGAVAISWFQTGSDPNAYREMATISTDGGKTFLPERSLATALSYPRNAGNIGYVSLNMHGKAGTPIPADENELSFLSAYNRWPDGGDYMGLTADAAGTFHAFWDDARNGAFIPWTASFAAATAQEAPSLQRADVTSDLNFIFSLESVDPATHEYTFDVRAKNVSNHPVYGPLTVRVVSTQDPYSVQENRVDPLEVATLLNASNNQSGAGATFEYPHIYGDFPALPPGALSSSVQWKFRSPDWARPSFLVKVQGYVPVSSSQ